MINQISIDDQINTNKKLNCKYIIISKVHMILAKFQNIDGNREIILISCSFDFLIDWYKNKQQKRKDDNCYQDLIANITN